MERQQRANTAGKSSETPGQNKNDYVTGGGGGAIWSREGESKGKLEKITH
jgi:hypothetical protein